MTKQWTDAVRTDDGMSRLARSGRYVAWIALAGWVLAAFVLMPLAGKTTTVVSTDAALTLPLSAEATQALVRERAAFPGADRPVAVVVYARDGGVTAADRSAVDADRVAFAALAHDSVVGPVRPSEDGRALMVSFPVAADPQDDEAAKAVVDRITDQLADAPPGLATAVTGSAGALADVADALGGIDTTLLLAAAVVVAVLLLIIYRSPVLWLLPLVSVGLASQLASGMVYLLARYAGVTVTTDAIGFMVVLVFGAGTDYALLIIARYREELHRHADRHTAMTVALRRSFPAILASAATVTVGMLCLLVARMNDVRGLGPVVATGIVVAFAIMTTLLPALLVLAGRWVFWPFIPRYVPGIGAGHPGGIWHRVADLVGRRPRTIWITTSLALLAVSSGVLGLRFGQPADHAYTKEVGSVTGQRLVDEHYAAGAAAPARILTAADHADGVVTAAAAVNGVTRASRTGVSADGRWARVEAVLADPPDSAAAGRTIDRLRAATHAVPGAEALVGGDTATAIDIERAAGRDNRLLLPLILAVVFTVLVLLLRALVLPLLLAGSVVVSYAAAMGVAGLLLRAMGYPGIVPALPLYGYLFLVTLGVDYTIFLMTRAREDVGRVGNRAGILSALAATGGVITSAGLVLAGTFSVLLVLPLVTALQIGLIVAVGVLLDTLVVRALLVPALAVDVGRRIWWPSRLAGAAGEPPRLPEPRDAEQVQPAPPPAGPAHRGAAEIAR